MISPPPSIIVTLPARGVSDAREQAETARSSGADLGEVRFDRFSEAERGRARELFPSELPLVATLRSRSEGGEGPDDPEPRARILSDLARLPFRWIDVELARDSSFCTSHRRTGPPGLIVSTHSRTPVRESEWNHLVREPIPPGAIRKVVVPAGVGQLLRELIPGLPPPQESPLVALTTGASGPLMRAWSRRFHFPIVYASLPEGEGPRAPAPLEPSQIPVDWLRPYLAADGSPPLFAVVGHPVAHSRSPALHARWMRQRHEIGLYVALDLGSDQEFVESLPSLADAGFRGLNVTHPYKGLALELASGIGSGAAACGVANTLTMVADGVEAENTDLVAILRRLDELHVSGTWDGASLGVIGAGGAARATLAAARTLGVEAEVWARRPEAADVLAREFDAHVARERSERCPTLVVHATPLGREPRGPADFPAPAGWLRSGTHVVDWVYAPEDPIVRVAALAAGATYEDGSRLLAYQAAASYGIWWGNEPSQEQIAAALEVPP